MQAGATKEEKNSLMPIQQLLDKSEAKDAIKK